MPSKPKSFMAGRATTPSSASDDDFEQVLGRLPAESGRRVNSADIPEGRLRPNPFQARREFEGLDELAGVIRAHGFTSRLRVRPDPHDEGYFQLVYGERRLRAARLAGLALLPCDVSDYSDRELLEIGLAENIQRRDLTPLEEAEAFRRFISLGDYTVRSLAERLGKNKDYVQGRLDLLKAPDEVRQLVAQRPDAVTAARRIARVESPTVRQQLVEAIRDGRLSKEQVRNYVREHAAGSRPPAEETAKRIDKEARVILLIVRIRL